MREWYTRYAPSGASAASDVSKGQDKEVVMKALAQYGRALEWASDTLRKDKEVVMAAVAEGVCNAR